MSYQQLDEILANKARLGIMTMLITLGKHGALDFNFIKDKLKLTDGNLASHMKKLHEAGYVSISKANIGGKSRTTYALTAEGEAAFNSHADAIRRVISGELY